MAPPRTLEELAAEQAPAAEVSRPSVLRTVGCSSRSTPGALLSPFNRRCDDPYVPSREH